MSSLFSRLVDFYRSGGKSFNGNRDLYRVFGWTPNPSHQNFVDKYRHHSVAKRVVDAPADALWSDPPSVDGGEAFNTAWKELQERIPVFPTLQRLDKLARLGRYAVLLVGYDGTNNALETPISPSVKRKVIFLQPYGEDSAKIQSLVDNPHDARFGLPNFYEITPHRNDVVTSGLMSPAFNIGHSLKVHHTRVLHVAENALESIIYGSSCLEPIFNDLCDLEKVVGASSETYWLAGNRGLHVDIDKDMELDEGDADALSDELKEYQHEIRRIIRTRGVQIKSLGSEFADPTGPYEVLMSNISSNSGIPKRVLTGAEAGQLASQQDRANWAQRVAERVSQYGTPTILVPFIKMQILAGTLPVPQGLKIEWPDAFKMNPLERAQTSAQMARSAANLSKTLLTVVEINQKNAENSREKEEPVFGGGGGFFGNASEDTAKDTAEDDTDTGSQEMRKIPALYPPQPMVTLLTEEECRNIIGFGKQAPVFESQSDDSPPAVKDPISED